MSLDTSGYRTQKPKSEHPLSSECDAAADDTTPVRRAALDALEREFSDLLARAAA